MGLIIVPKHIGFYGEHEVEDVDELMYDIFGNNVSKITAKRDLLDTGCSFAINILREFLGNHTKEILLSYYMSVMGKGDDSYGILHASNMRDISSGTSLIHFLLVGETNFVDLQSESLRDIFSRATGNELTEVKREFLELFESEGNGPYCIYLQSRNKTELREKVRKEISRIRSLVEETRE